MSSTVGDMNHCSPNYYAYIAVSQLAYGQSYTLDLQNGTNTVKQVTYQTTTSGTGSASVEKILEQAPNSSASSNPDGGLVPQLTALTISDMGATGAGTDPFFTTAIRIGNGVYLESPQQFTVNTPEGQLFDVMSINTDVAANDEHGQKRYAAIQNVAALPA